jgi:hypothetical protein
MAPASQSGRRAYESADGAGCRRAASDLDNGLAICAGPRVQIIHDVGRVLLPSVPDVPPVEAVHPLKQTTLEATNRPADSHGLYRSVGNADRVWVATAFRISASS